jgi:hypothetical protein
VERSNGSKQAQRKERKKKREGEEDKKERKEKKAQSTQLENNKTDYHQRFDGFACVALKQQA